MAISIYMIYDHIFKPRVAMKCGSNNPMYGGSCYFQIGLFIRFSKSPRFIQRSFPASVFSMAHHCSIISYRIELFTIVARFLYYILINSYHIKTVFN